MHERAEQVLSFGRRLLRRLWASTLMRLDVLLDLFFGVMLLFGAVNAYAPAQDLPWKPLRLSDPIGLATAYKLEQATANPTTCLAFLADNGVAFRPLPYQDEQDYCVVANPVRLGDADLTLQTPNPLMSCPMAAAFVLWERQSVVPAARRILGTEAVGLDHVGTYTCRRMRSEAAIAPSAHSRADAIDVAGFRLADGRTLSIEKSWKGNGAESAFVHTVYGGACQIFHTTLSPQYNRAHAAHLHLDMGPDRFCR